MDEVADSAALIAYCWVDLGLKACEDALTVLLELYFKAVDAEISRFCIIVIASDVEEALIWLRNSDRTPTSVFVVPHGGDTDRTLRPLFGLSLVLQLPTVVLYSTLLRQPICTDGVAALQRGILDVSNFPHGWRTNCYRAQRAPLVPPAAAFLASPDSLYRCGLYTGDIACVQALASREAAYCYVNPPEGEDDVPVDALAVTEGTERTDAIFLSSDMFDALFGAAPEGLVCLVPELDVPESIQVDVCCATQATMTTDSLKASLDAQFGTGSRVDARVDAVAAAFNAARPNAEEDAAVSSWMTRYLAASTCPYTPVWRGMRFAVNSVEFTVAAVTPSSPARVGPSTVFCIRYV